MTRFATSRAPSGDVENGWDLREFDRGWLLDKIAAKDRRGGLAFVIERDSARVMSFPSFVPPGLIMADYDDALSGGLPKEF
jgi:hypothetical protein